MSEWTKVPLGTLGRTYSGLSGKKASDFGEGANYIPYMNIFSSGRISPLRLERVRIDLGERQNQVQYGDIFFTTSSETVEDVGTTSVLLDNLADTYLNSFCFGFRLHSFDLLTPEFAIYLLRGQECRKVISDLGQGSTRYNLPKRILLKSLLLNLPPLPQQRKIASILTTVDNLIEKTEALIAKYQAIKQGMMHDLFTRGVDQHGHLRPPYEEAPELYKESELGWIPKEWEAPNVSSVLQQRPKNGYSPKESNEWTGVLMLGLGCLTLSGFEAVQLKNAPKDDPNVVSALLRNGDLLISRSNTRDLVALVGRYQDVGMPCIYSDLMMRLVPTDAVLPDFMEAVLRHAPVRRQLTNASCGTSGSMMKINSEMVLNTVIVLPKKDEQKAILDRVESISRFILQSRMELAKYAETKSGLMQDLLTGKVRVKVDESKEVASV